MSRPLPLEPKNRAPLARDGFAARCTVDQKVMAGQSNRKSEGEKGLPIA